MAYVGQVSTSGAGSTTLTTGARTTTGGNLSLICVAWVQASSNTLSSVSDSKGNSYSRVASDVALGTTQTVCSMWVAQNITGGSTTYSATNSVTGQQLIVIGAEFSGRATSGAVRVTASASSTGYTESYPGATVAAGTNDDVVAWGVNSYGNPSQTFTAGSGFTISVQFAGNGAGAPPGMLQYLAGVSAGNVTAAFSGSPSYNQYAQLVIALQVPIIPAPPSVRKIKKSFLPVYYPS